MDIANGSGGPQQVGVVLLMTYVIAAAQLAHIVALSPSAEWWNRKR